MNPQPDQDTTQGQKNTVEQPALGVPVTGSPDKHKRPVGLLLVIGVLLVVAVIVGGVLFSRPKIYGQVGTHKITQSELDKSLENSVQVTKEKAVTALLDSYLYEEIAKEYGITVTDNEVQTELKNRVGGKEDFASRNHILVSIKRDLYKEKLTKRFQGYSRGEFIISRFDQNIRIEGIGRTREEAAMTPEQIQNLIDSDKQYAADFINNVSKRLKSGQINFAAAMEEQRNDPRMGIKAQPTILQSGKFDTADSKFNGREQFKQAQIVDKLNSLRPGDISDPITGNVSTSTKPNTPMRDGFYMIIKLDDKQTTLGAFKSFDEMTNSYKNKLGYKLAKT